MERLTHVRNNGIKTGYWSPNKKEELVQRLAAYENTGMTPEEIRSNVPDIYVGEWIPADNPPKPEEYVLLSFSNFTIPLVGMYRGDESGGGSYYVGDDDESCMKHGVYVIAWMPLPEPYKGE